MLKVAGTDGPKPKCFFTSSVLPTFVNHDQVPAKKKPFSTISSQKFNHTLEVILSKANADTLQQSLSGGAGTLQYARIYMKLSDVIDGDFFNQYIKTGNILMLSEGRPGIDHVYSLSDGMLRLEVNKSTFERMGLDGSPISTEGCKYVKARYAIEINLRLPSMIRGKKGFERIIWAFKNVLDHSIAWLFYNLKGPTDGSGPIAGHQPHVRKVDAESETTPAAKIPVFPKDLQQDDSGATTELLEWITLAINGSPRIQHQDEIAPYLSRYRIPLDKDDISMVGDLVRLRWHGFMPTTFVTNVYLTALKASGDGWFAIQATAFDGTAYTILQNKHHTTTWQYTD